MSKPRLTYLNMTGRAEIIRLTFAAAGVDFEDNRIAQEKWPEVKKTSPTGVLPWVDAQEGALVQSGAIARYYAKQHGLMGKTDFEYFLVERALAQADDVYTELVKVFVVPGDQKAEAMKNFQENKAPGLLQSLEGFLKDGGSSGLFVPSGLTLADLQVLHIVDLIARLCGNLVTKFPKLKQHTEKVKAVSPKVKKWLETRPKTDM